MFSLSTGNISWLRAELCLLPLLQPSRAPSCPWGGGPRTLFCHPFPAAPLAVPPHWGWGRAEGGLWGKRSHSVWLESRGKMRRDFSAFFSSKKWA